MLALITADSAKIDHCGLTAATTKADLCALLGAPTRTDVQSCSMSKGGTRTAYVYDEAGVIFYHDEPEDTVSHITLAVSPAETPKQPARPFAGEIHFRGSVLDEETGEKPFLQTHGDLLSGHHWLYSLRADSFSCWFAFGKVRNQTGKKAGPAKLLYVQISFSNRGGS
jgi:hypothetical protein